MATVRVYKTRADVRNTVCVYKVSAESHLVTTARVYSVKAFDEWTATVRVYSSKAALAPSSASVRVYSSKSTAGGAVVAGPDQFDVAPHSIVTLTASGGTWTQLDGDPVTLVGTGSTVTFRAPDALADNVLRFVASDGATTDICSVTVAPHSAFVRAGSNWTLDRDILTRQSGTWV